MLKAFIRFLIYTAVVFIGGVAVSGVGLSFFEIETPSVLAFVGALIILLSPITASFVVWKRRKKETSKTAVGRKARGAQRKNARKTGVVKRRHARKTTGAQRKNARRPRLLAKQKRANSAGLRKTTLFQNIKKWVSKISRGKGRATHFDAHTLPRDGHAFEKWVAEALIGFGWDAEVTRSSGDQGIDVIAVKKGIKLGLQCKLYSSSIGNKAVQEAYAGKAYYSTDQVGVLSNAKYTASAKDLANVTGVHLFSHHDIPTLFEKIK